MFAGAVSIFACVLSAYLVGTSRVVGKNVPPPRVNKTEYCLLSTKGGVVRVGCSWLLEGYLSLITVAPINFYRLNAEGVLCKT